MKWVLPLVLAGCTTAATLPRVDIPLRNPTAPIASQADVTLKRLAGEWIVVSGAGLAPGTRVRVTAKTLELDGVALALADTGEGRLLVGGDPVWVHWLDIGNRTAALGDPNGSRVWIMDRTGAPGDRLAAARKILTWYGYDLDRMSGA
ncbi:lipocalin [Aestuariicoccus sp. MJ-SS9]|uniref:lipocalin n=1 Tax=Aestuariicoccus sp. MJ-SS9 TaxID=3079855 RepID=UPI0029155B05|nr:lipocalin [Aestuariicoccus sp. MJ-SS9]MDU8913105.1 lipocalin [Aestuariicoccus sp. MJ-SS9]